MCFAFKKNNKQRKKPVNCFLQEDASPGIQSLQTSIEIKLCQNPWNGLCRHLFRYSLPPNARYTWLYNNIPVNQCKVFRTPSVFYLYDDSLILCYSSSFCLVFPLSLVSIEPITTTTRTNFESNKAISEKDDCSTL